MVLQTWSKGLTSTPMTVYMDTSTKSVPIISSKYLLILQQHTAKQWELERNLRIRHLQISQTLHKVKVTETMPVITSMNLHIPL